MTGTKRVVRKISAALFLLLSIALVAVGAIYLTAAEFMPYHSAAIEAEWSDLDSNYRALMLGFLKGLGAGSLVVGIGIAVMSVALYRDPAGSYAILLPTLSVGYTVLLSYATFTVYSGTPGNPPLGLALGGIGVSAVATLLMYSSNETGT